MTGKTVIIQRDGKDYVTLSDLSVSNQVSNYRAYIHYDNNIASTIYSLVDGTINSNWRILKPMIDPTINRFIGEILEDVVTPIFNEIPLQDFFNMNF